MMAVIYLVAKSAAVDSISLPRQITDSSVCPVAGCSAKTCHGAQPAPMVEASQTMKCPKVGCEAATCHARDRLISHHHAPKGASLDLWVLGLSMFTIAMILIALYM
jgi:hypothetical protein